MVERSPGGNGPQRIDGDAARPGATAVLPAALAALVDPVVGILLLAGIFDGISGNPIHGVVLCGVAFALAVDGFGRRRGEPAPQEQAAPLFHAERVPTLLVVALAAVFAFVVGGFGRYSWPATVVVVCPALEIVITPPHMQLQVEELVSAGWLPIVTVGEPGDQGALVTGMQGWGVRTPRAAAVAAATCGLDGLVHIPKVGMFIIGT